MTEIADSPRAGVFGDDEDKAMRLGDGERDITRPQSRLEELRAAFNERTAEPRLFKRLPGGGGRLVAEYRVLTAAETTEALADPETTAQNADVLVRALVAIHAHDPKHPDANDRGAVDLASWLDIDAGGPLRFDRRLLDALGISLDDTSARSIALRLFDGNEIALGAQAAQVMAWMTDTNAEALQDFVSGS